MLKNIHSLTATFFIILLSALLYFFGVGFNDSIWPLVWIAPLPILFWVIYQKNPLFIFFVAFSARLLGGLGFIHYWSTPIPVYVFLPMALLEALGFGLIILLFCQILKNKKNGNNAWYILFIFPLLTVIWAFILSHFSSTSNLAYSQLNNLPLLQVISLTGMWGMDFLIALFPASIVTAWFLRNNFKQCLFSLLIPFLILLSAFLWGEYRLTTQQITPSYKIGLLSVPETIKEVMAKDPKQVAIIAKRYLAEIPALAKKNAHTVLMPEKILILTPQSQTQILTLFQKSARINQVMLIFGVSQIYSEKKYNTVFVINKRGRIIAQYHKHHLLKMFEGDYVSGKKLATFPFSSGLAGLTICKDMDYLFPSLDYSRQGVGIFFVPAMDFIIDAGSHAKPATMRGIEGAYTVVRVAQWGLLTVTDLNGRILARKKTSLKHPASLVVDLPVGLGKTFYSQWNDWFVWLCVLIVCFIYYGRKRAN